MNFKKLKLWKLLAVGGVVGLVATVPIIATACSTTESDVIKLKSNINADNPLHIISSFKKLIYKGNENNIDKNLLDKNVSELISNSDKYKNKLIENYENIKNEINSISFESSGSNDPWGTQRDWVDGQKAPNTIVYYQENKQFNVNSILDLKTKLSGNNNEILKKIMDNSLKGTPEDDQYTSYEFANGSALLADENGDYLRMHVKATPKNALFKNNPKDIELRIPTSDINYQPTSVKITIKTKEGSKLQGINGQETFITYDIGVEATPHITPATGNDKSGKFEENIDTKTLRVDLSENNSNIQNQKYGSVTPKNLANSLGWTIATSPKSYIIQQSFKNNKENPEQFTLNNKKISEDLKIFNATFSDLRVESSDGKNPSDDGYTGQYKIKMKATLLEGYSWDDGAEDKTREITLNSNVGTSDKNENFLINISDAAFVTTDLFTGDANNYEFNDDTHTDIKKPDSTTNNSSEFKKFFDSNKLKTLITIFNNELNKGDKNSVGVRIELDVNSSERGFMNGIDETTQKIKIKVVTKDGHIFKNKNDQTSFDISIKSWKKTQ